MRRLAAAVLAVPVLASIYLGIAITVPQARRYLAGAIAIITFGVIGIAIALPTPAASIPPSQPSPIPAEVLQPVETTIGAGPSPSAASADSIAFVSDSAAGASADDTGAADATAASAPFLGIAGARRTDSASTVAPARLATTATLAGSKVAGKRIRLDTSFVVRFNRAVPVSAVRAALSIAPAVKGSLKATTPGSTAKAFVFTPSAPLAVNTAYTLSFKRAIKDVQGVAVAAPKPTRLLTAAAPALIRFRPGKGSTNIDPTQLVSVRFTKAMNRATTARAFSVVVNGRKVSGKLAWAESDTVLVFTPTKPFTKGTGVGVRLLGTATSTDGVPIKRGGSATFKVLPKPVVAVQRAASKPTPKPVARPTKPKPRSGGGSVGGGAWAAAERYYLTLMNCTRTGGFVTSSGDCNGAGDRNVAPLWIDPGISANVSRPYAKYLATTGICSHFADGNPGHRLARAGYHSFVWAENISCPKNMDVMALMVYTQQYFQAERSYGGGHYVNLMNAAYDRVGIGVWVANGRAEVVIDFYRP